MAATDRSPRKVGPALRARVLRGRDLLREHGGALDELDASSDAPITARRPWLQTWIECYDDYEPWGVAVAGEDGRLDAVALFGERRRRGITEIVGLGHGPSDMTRFPARSPEAADAVAAVVTALLRRRRGAWSLRVEQLPVGDPVAAGIARRSSHAAIVPGDGSPVTEFDRGRDPRVYIGRNGRGVANKMRNRMKRAGMELVIECMRDPERVVQALPEVEKVHRDRDRQLVRKSDLEDPRMARFWRAAIAQAADRGELELVALRLSGTLAGYVVGLLDGRSYRMWDARFAPQFSHFSPGRMADQAAILSSLDDQRVEEFDWMRGEEEYKVRSASRVDPAQHLLAWSSRPVRAIVEGPRAAKRGLKQIRDRSTTLQRAWLAFKARVVVKNRPR